MSKHDNNKNPCEWNGVKYKTQREAAEALGIKEATMHKRIKNGWTCDADIPLRRTATPWYETAR